MPRTIAVLCLLFVVAVACEKEMPVITIPEESVDEETGVDFLYTADASDKFEIWKSQGSEQIQLTSNPNFDCWWPTMSPDKSTILYYQSNVGRELNDYGSASLWQMNADGGEQKELFAQGANEWELQGFARWSNDNEWIVMAAQDKNVGRFQIYVCDRSGQQIRRISLDNSADYVSPVFAIDNQSVFCVKTSDLDAKESHEIYRLDFITGEETRLTFNNFLDHFPDVSPDGTKLVYQSMVDPTYPLGQGPGRWALRELNLATGKESDLLSDASLNFFPRYSKDGSSVLFVRLNIIEDTTTSVCKLKLDDKTVTRLTDTKFNSAIVEPF